MEILSNKDVNLLHESAIKYLMITEAKTNGCFLTNNEFEKNKGKIYDLSYAKSNLLKKLKATNSK